MAAGVAVLALAHLTTAAVVVGAGGGLAALGLTIWFSVMFSLAAPAAALGRQGPAGALGRSWRLVRRSFWRVIGILLLTALIVGFAGLALRVPFGLLATVAGGSGGILGLTGARGVAGVVIGAAGSVVAGAVTRPVSAGVTVLLYLDLRMRQEGPDLARPATAARQDPCRQESR